jgi:hypothetical protein
MIYTNNGMPLATLSYVTCDVIPRVCPLVDHACRPMKAPEFLTLLHVHKFSLLTRTDEPNLYFAIFSMTSALVQTLASIVGF